MFIIIEKGGDVDKPITVFTTFGKAAKWLVSSAEFIACSGAILEVWWVKRFKRQKDEVWLEAEYEVLP